MREMTGEISCIDFDCCVFKNFEDEVCDDIFKQLISYHPRYHDTLGIITKMLGVGSTIKRREAMGDE